MTKQNDFEIDLNKLEANSKYIFHPAKHFENFQAENVKKYLTN